MPRFKWLSVGRKRRPQQRLKPTQSHARGLGWPGINGANCLETGGRKHSAAGFGIESLSPGEGGAADG